jgi:WXXGXW repeat (2 copies)
MKCRIAGLIAVSLPLLLAAYMPSAAQTNPYGSDSADQQPPMPPDEQPAGAEVLTRGPVHEAFDEPVSLQAQAGVVTPNRPPPAIEEIPPADRPQGDRYVWVPGYWGWDADRDDFIWVSACWRIAPPNMYWVPGYWTPVAGGYEWVPGFWLPVSERSIDYLPAPPATMDIEPPGPPPSTDRVWVPGCWYWSQGRYVRRAGYWLRQQPGWVWAPSHYNWTPRGYVFVAGHWDYPTEDRGVLFAPVYFPHAVYARVGFSYSPSIVLDIGLLVADMFSYPRYSHYYFGDYYDDSYLRIGIFPRFDCVRLHTWYDPGYQYDRWRNRRTDPKWEERQRQDYDHRRADATLRPPRTYRDLEARKAKLPEPQRRGIELAGPMRTIVERQARPIAIERIDPGQRRKIAGNDTEVRKFRDERAKWEAPAPAPSATPPPTGERRETTKPPTEAKRPTPPATAPREVRATRPERVAVPVPPIVARPVVQAGKVQNTPRAPSAEAKRQAAPQKAKPKPKDKKKE